MPSRRLPPNWGVPRGPFPRAVFLVPPVPTVPSCLLTHRHYPSRPLVQPGLAALTIWPLLGDSTMTPTLPRSHRAPRAGGE